ncbi:hypothetical protein GCM10010300_64610 [Streptomyces olivaceoviridis]|uniref:hypothetical protein n=1 Tax=Streptomyces olivaceoviridis TaxID=1921 RepID=UPI0019AC536A|nr:hypothetical protein [Streptomyces olivaceoviridis]GGZ11572.1 hypothetical protein GCM10010300_64610 [Streptomyces olivaceoviridis]
MRHPLHRPHGRGHGYVETGISLARPERHARGTGLADIADPHVEPVGPAADWLRLCGTDRVPAGEPAEDTAATETPPRRGASTNRPRTDRGREHRPRRPDPPRTRRSS